MRIIDFYIGRIIASTTFITLAVFISVSGIIKFVEEMRFIGQGDYDLAHAALFIVYAIPRDIELFFPMSGLIGGLIGMGMLASNSELVVMQAAGLSRLDIIKSVMKTASILIIISMAIGEWLAPQSEAKARDIRTQAMSSGSLISARNGVWAKDGDYFVNIGEVLKNGLLKKVQIYGFNEELKIDGWIIAKEAVYKNKSWLLIDVEEFSLNDTEINIKKYKEKVWKSSLTPKKLGVVTVTPESLSLRGLMEYLDYLEANEQDARRYQLAFGRKIMQPLTVAVMLLLALSFIFGPLRSVSMGARIMMGVFTGILFFLSNEVLGSLSLVYQLSPIMGATLPSICFLGIAWYFISKKGV